MPYLEITACVDCPHSYTSNRDKDDRMIGDDQFYIKCIHEDQTDREGFVAKLKNRYNHIYFKCPLLTKEEIEDGETE